MSHAPGSDPFPQPMRTSVDSRPRFPGRFHPRARPILFPQLPDENAVRCGRGLGQTPAVGSGDRRAR